MVKMRGKLIYMSGSEIVNFNMFKAYFIIGIFLLSVLTVTAFHNTMETPGTRAGETDDRWYATLLATSTSTTLYCPRFEQTSSWDTTIRLFNPDDSNTASITLKFYTEDGVLSATKTDTISPENTLEFTPDDYQVYDLAGNIVITSDYGLVGSIIREGAYYAAAELLQVGGTEDVLYCPYFRQDGQWDTYISLNYHGNDPSIAVTLYFYKTDGTYIDDYEATINNHATFYKSVNAMSITENYGSIRISAGISSGTLTGYTLRTDGDIANSEPLIRTLTDDAVAPYSIFDKGTRSQDTYIKILNPGSSNLTVSFDIYTSLNGTLVDSNSTTIAPFAIYELDVSTYTNGPMGSVKFSNGSGGSRSGGSFTGMWAMEHSEDAGMSGELSIGYASIGFLPYYQVDDLTSNDHDSGYLLIGEQTQVNTNFDTKFLDESGQTLKDNSNLVLVGNGLKVVEGQPQGPATGVIHIDPSLYDIGGWGYGRNGYLDCDNCGELENCNNAFDCPCVHNQECTGKTSCYECYTGGCVGNNKPGECGPVCDESDEGTQHCLIHDTNPTGTCKDAQHGEGCTGGDCTCGWFCTGATCLDGNDPAESQPCDGKFSCNCLKAECDEAGCSWNHCLDEGAKKECFGEVEACGQDGCGHLYCNCEDGDYCGGPDQGQPCTGSRTLMDCVEGMDCDYQIGNTAECGHKFYTCDYWYNVECPEDLTCGITCVSLP